MSDQDQSSPFEELDLSPADILGERTFEGLYSVAGAEAAVPVHFATGEPTVSIPSVEEATAFAEDAGDHSDRPYVAKLRRTESIAETGGAPYSAVVFCHYSIVGGMDRHRAYLAAYDSPDFDVDIATDYEVGEVTIAVAQSDSGDPA